jgi:hypothetical protein
LRTDDVLDEGEKLSNFNMKIELKYQRSVYKQRAEDDSYYRNRRGGNYISNRPLKLIELTNGEKTFGA